MGSTIDLLADQFRENRMYFTKMDPRLFWQYYIEMEHRLKFTIKEIKECRQEYDRLTTDFRNKARNEGYECRDRESRDGYIDGCAKRHIHVELLPNFRLMTDALKNLDFTLEDIVDQRRESSALAHRSLGRLSGRSETEVGDWLTVGRKMREALLETAKGIETSVSDRRSAGRILAEAVRLWKAKLFFTNQREIEAQGIEAIETALNGKAVYNSSRVILNTTCETIGVSSFNNYVPEKGQFVLFPVGDKSKS
jgi:hypothetical protein